MPVGTVYTIRDWTDQISFNGRLATASCPNCHIVHAFPEEMKARIEAKNNLRRAMYLNKYRNKGK